MDLLSLPAAASFASLSAFLLPATSLCPEIHLSLTLALTLFIKSAKFRHKYWPGMAVGLDPELTKAWLSE